MQIIYSVAYLNQNLRITKAYDSSGMGIELREKESSIIINASGRPRLLLVGNGVNLAAKCHTKLSYQEVLRGIVGKYDIKVEDRASINEMQQKIADYEEKHPNEEPFQELLKELENLRPTHAHYLLSAFSGQFEKILTLNFDYALEKTLSLSPCHENMDSQYSVPRLKQKKKVCHIHGSIGNKKKKGGCIISLKSYTEALRNYPETIPDNFPEQVEAERPWWHDFITKEVHICGAALGDDEKILYRVLELRMQWIDKLPNRGCPWTNRIYAYLFETTKEKKSGTVQNVADRLLALRVYPIIIPVRKLSSGGNNFNAAWEQLVGKLILHFNNICVFPDALQNLPLTKRTADRTRHYNVSLSTVPDLKHPGYYVFAPSMKMLDAALAQGIKKWLFYVIKDEAPLYWWVDLSELLSFVKEIEQTGGASFYLDPQSGHLLNIATLHQSAFVCKHTNEGDFDLNIKKIKISHASSSI